MALDKNEIMQLSSDKKCLPAFELLDSIDKEFVNQSVTNRKKY